MKMSTEELDDIIEKHRLWLAGKSRGRRADPIGADLRDATLPGADLSLAILRDADLRGAILHNADLRGANLRNANLSGAALFGANLRCADLSGTNLLGADLRCATLLGADLHNANLHDANLDFSCWPLCYGSLSPRIDKRIAAQLMYHAMRAMQSCADDPDVAAVLASEPCLRLANQFHRADECGKIAEAKEARNE